MVKEDWKSYVQGHFGTYKSFMFPLGSLEESFMNEIQEWAVEGEADAENRTLRYWKEYIVITCHAPQERQREGRYFTHAVIFPRTIDVLHDRENVFIDFSFITNDELDKVNKNQVSLEECVSGNLEQIGRRTEHRETAFAINPKTLVDTVCECLYQKEVKGKGICIEVPEEVPYQEYCKYVLAEFFSCVPYKMRDGLSYATNPARKQKNNFLVTFVKSNEENGERRGICLSEPWNERKYSYEPELKTLILKIRERPELIQTFYEELEKEISEKQISYADYILFSKLECIQETEVLTAPIVREWTKLIGEINSRGVAVLKKRLYQLLSQKQKAGMTAPLNMQKVFGELIVPSGDEGYSGLFMQLDQYREFIDALYTLREENKSMGIFPVMYGTELLQNAASVQTCSAGELFDEFTSWKDKFRFYLGNAVNNHEKWLYARLKDAKDADRNKFTQDVNRAFKDGRYDKLLLAYNNWVRSSAGMRRNFRCEKEMQEYAAGIIMEELKLYLEVHQNDFSVEEMRSEDYPPLDHMEEWISFWDKDGSELDHALSEEDRLAWKGASLKRSEFLKNVRKQYRNIVSFYDYIKFIQQYGPRDEICEVLRARIPNSEWREGLSGFACAVFRVEKERDSLESGLPQEWYYQELGQLIQQGRMKLYLMCYESISTFFNHLSVWYHLGNQENDTIIIHCDITEDIVLTKKAIRDCCCEIDQRVPYIFMNEIERQLIWERMIPLGMISVEPIADELNRGDFETLFTKREEDLKKAYELLFSWIVRGPGIPWNVKEKIYQYLLNANLLPEDAKQQVNRAETLSELEKRRIAEIADDWGAERESYVEKEEERRTGDKKISDSGSKGVPDFADNPRRESEDGGAEQGAINGKNGVQKHGISKYALIATATVVAIAAAVIGASVLKTVFSGKEKKITEDRVSEHHSQIETEEIHIKQAESAGNATTEAMTTEVPSTEQKDINRQEWLLSAEKSWTEQEYWDAVTDFEKIPEVQVCEEIKEYRGAGDLGQQAAREYMAMCLFTKLEGYEQLNLKNVEYYSIPEKKDNFPVILMEVEEKNRARESQVLFQYSADEERYVSSQEQASGPGNDSEIQNIIKNLEDSNKCRHTRTANINAALGSIGLTE